MNKLRLIIKRFALAMLLVQISTTMSNYAFKKQLVEPLQQAASQTAYIAADDGDGLFLKDFKPPKYSFIDYETLFSNPVMMPEYLPEVSDLVAHHEVKAPPEVYPEIFVPPQNPISVPCC